MSKNETFKRFGSGYNPEPATRRFFRNWILEIRNLFFYPLSSLDFFEKKI